MREIVFQTEIAKLHHQAMHFPAQLYGRPGAHRLQIAGDLEALRDVLSTLRLHDLQWLVFASEDALEDSPVPLTRLELDRDQSRRFEYLCMFNNGVYATFADLGRATELMASSLWDLGAGIALPIPERGEASVKEALEIQLALGDRLVQAVEGRQGAFLMACTDAWGVDLVWNETSSHAPHFEDIAQRLAK